MKKVFKVVVIAAMAAALVIAALFFFKLMPGQEPGPITGRSPEAELEGPKVIDLYFADANGRRLALEAREVTTQSVEESIHQAIRELIAGPRKKSLSSTVPEGVGIRSVYYRDDIAYIDLTLNISSSHPGGSWAELLTVYSIINTVTENFSEVRKVQILLGGRERETLAGHIDISRPLPGRVQLLAGDW